MLVEISRTSTRYDVEAPPPVEGAVVAGRDRLMDYPRYTLEVPTLEALVALVMTEGKVVVGKSADHDDGPLPGVDITVEIYDQWRE